MLKNWTIKCDQNHQPEWLTKPSFVKILERMLGSAVVNLKSYCYSLQSNRRVKIYKIVFKISQTVFYYDTCKKF